MTEDENNYIKHCVLHAKESFNTAQLLAKHKSWSSCANRLYYACLHSASGLLYKYNIKVKTHKGMDKQFHLHFIKTGIMPKEQGELFTTLKEMRNDSDYEAWQDLTEENVKPFIPQVKKFISEIEKLIKE